MKRNTEKNGLPMKIKQGHKFGKKGKEQIDS